VQALQLCGGYTDSIVHARSTTPVLYPSYTDSIVHVSLSIVYVGVLQLEVCERACSAGGRDVYVVVVGRGMAGAFPFWLHPRDGGVCPSPAAIGSRVTSPSVLLRSHAGASNRRRSAEITPGRFAFYLLAVTNWDMVPTRHESSPRDTLS
jgi:hypothetical protein